MNSIPVVKLVPAVKLFLVVLSSASNDLVPSYHHEVRFRTPIYVFISLVYLDPTAGYYVRTIFVTVFCYCWGGVRGGSNNNESRKEDSVER